MKSFINYLIESKHDFSKTIAIVAGSFKPPTAGHFDMIQKYIDKSDEVVVLVSDPTKSIRTTKLGTVITPQMSKEILELYLKRYKLNNVNVEVSTDASPITAMFKYVDNNLKDVNVIFGVSKKDGDESRFKSAMKYYADNEHINLLDPLATAVEPYASSDGTPISATDIRNNIDNPEIIKPMLPAKLTDTDIQKVIAILSDGKKLNESDSEQSLKPLDETESIRLQINDDVLMNARIKAYNVGQTVADPETSKEVPVNPKKFPTKAVDIIFPVQQLLVEVFFDPVQKKWDSDFIFDGKHGKLSPDQMGEFFNTQFYDKLIQKLGKNWPLSDQFYGELYEGIQNKEMKVYDEPTIDEDQNDPSIDGTRDYTPSGRKIVNFSDTNVSSKDAVFFCWPDEKKAYKWSSWKDWKKIKPLCRMRFKYNGIPFGISLSTLGTDKDYKNRGFRGYDLDPELTPTQWLTKEENESIMKLSLVNKFVKHCVEKIERHLAESPEEIYEKINAPDKITLKEVRKTWQCIHNTLVNVIKTKQIDSFKWN